MFLHYLLGVASLMSVLSSSSCIDSFVIITILFCRLACFIQDRPVDILVIKLNVLPMKLLSVNFSLSRFVKYLETRLSSVVEFVSGELLK